MDFKRQMYVRTESTGFNPTMARIALLGFKPFLARMPYVVFNPSLGSHDICGLHTSGGLGVPKQPH